MIYHNGASYQDIADFSQISGSRATLPISPVPPWITSGGRVAVR
jgi:hypothetical protein